MTSTRLTLPACLLLMLTAAIPALAEVLVEIEVPGEPARMTATTPAQKLADGAQSAVVLPYFTADSRPNGVTTFYAVRNNSPNQVPLRYSYYGVGGGDPLVVEQSPLAPHAVRTVNLRAISGLDTGDDGIARGFLVAEALGGNVRAGTLSGDYFRVDATGAEANGGTLIAAETASCRRWSHRFLSGGGFDGGTRIAILALDGPNQGPVVAGNVFDEAGNQVATVSLSSHETAFEISDADLALPIPFGSIEWVFLGNAHGAVSTTFTANGLLSVGMEASCIDGLEEPAVPGSVVFELPGNFLTCQGCGNWQYDMPMGQTRQFSRVEIDFDVFVAGWDVNRPGGFHCIFWLNNGVRWQDMMGYMNTRGTGNRTVFQVNGPLGSPIGVERYASPTVEIGKTYHVHYEYDTVENAAWYEIRDASGNLRVSDVIGLPPNSGPITTSYTFIQFGSQPGGAVESLTEGWRWFDFKAVFVP